jgi:hypothetical protein
MRLFSLLHLLGQASLRMEQALWPEDYERMTREVEEAPASHRRQRRIVHPRRSDQAIQPHRPGAETSHLLFRSRSAGRHLILIACNSTQPNAQWRQGLDHA